MDIPKYVTISVTNSLSFSLDEQAVLRASTRSLKVLLLGIVIVTGCGKVVSLVLKTVKIIGLIVVERSSLYLQSHSSELKHMNKVQ